MNSSTDLHSAKRTLEKAKAAFQNLMLTPAVRMQPIHGDNAQWQDLYYSSSTLKSFRSRFAAFNNAYPNRAEAVRTAASAVIAAWEAYDVARLAEKARLTEKRAAVKAKASLKADLNLQPGVSLKGVDVGQYEVILKGLEPVRLHVYGQKKAGLETELSIITRLLADHGNNIDVACPKTYATLPLRSREWDDAYESYLTRVNNVRKWFTFSYDGAAVLRLDNAERIESSAQQFALAYVQGYAAKLAVKTGEQIANDPALAGFRPLAASVSSTNLWRDSEATILLGKGEQRDNIKFHTQIIWNRSCLGNVFNQYPTRRMA